MNDQVQQQQSSEQYPAHGQQQFGGPNVMPPPQQKKGIFKRKSTWFILAAVLVLIIIGASMTKGGNTSSTGTTQSNGTPAQGGSQAQPTTAPTKAAVWTTTHTFTGNGVKKTEVFHVGSDWKITWSCDPASFGGSQYNVIVMVYNSDGTLVDGAVNTLCKSGNTGDMTEEHQGGDVYLDITSEGSWKIQVQELK